MPLYRVVLLSFAAVMSMVNPFAVIPAFIALTERVDSRRNRARVAFVAAAGSVAVLVTFLLAGNFLFKFFKVYTTNSSSIIGIIINTS